MLTKNLEAILSNADGFTSFNYGGYNIRLRAPYSLERYVDVVSWDAEPEEEYIDLKPILYDLYIDSVVFLKPIQSVRVLKNKD